MNKLETRKTINDLRIKKGFEAIESGIIQRLTSSTIDKFERIFNKLGDRTYETNRPLYLAMSSATLSVSNDLEVRKRQLQEGKRINL